MPIAIAVQCREDIMMARSNTGIAASYLALDLDLGVCQEFFGILFFPCGCASSVNVVLPNIHKLRYVIIIYEEEEIRGNKR
jgi:hypothetical protein